MEQNEPSSIDEKTVESNVQVPLLEPVKPKKIKGVRNPHLYKREIIKNARLRGEEYINTKGVLVPARCVPGPDCICKDRCTKLFTQEEKELILKNLYDGKPKNEQDTFLMGLIEHQDVSRRRSRNKPTQQIKISLVEQEEDKVNAEENENEKDKNDDDDKKDFMRKHTYKYYALKGTKTVGVCKQAFKSLYAIKNKALYRLCLLKSTPYVSPRDMRGRHLGRPNLIPEEVRIAINSHISSFPLKQSKIDPKIKYLDSNLTIRQMHRHFKEKFSQYANRVSYEFYRQYFRENYNYSFFKQNCNSCKVNTPVSSNKPSRKNPNPKKINVETIQSTTSTNSNFVSTTSECNNVSTVSQYIPNSNVKPDASFYLGHIVH